MRTVVNSFILEGTFLNSNAAKTFWRRKRQISSVSSQTSIVWLKKMKWNWTGQKKQTPFQYQHEIASNLFTSFWMNHSLQMWDSSILAPFELTHYCNASFIGLIRQKYDTQLKRQLSSSTASDMQATTGSAEATAPSAEQTIAQLAELSTFPPRQLCAQ